mmetsp:Transcript_6330/g.24420  ORF Transcript_6330/g.24420 Transcript_6330/m.24420 type:complete len:546 (-) Transcript_6330:532-2169(-)
MRRYFDGGAVIARGCSKGQRVRRRRPRAVAHRGEPADVVVVESVRTFPGVREVAGSNPGRIVVVVVEELAAAQLDASKRDPAGRNDARSAHPGIEPGTFFSTATRRVRAPRRRALERRRRENARASHDFPGDQPTSRPFFSTQRVGSRAIRAVVVILREHGIDESRAARVLSASRPSVLSDIRKSSGKGVPARNRTRDRRETPPIALRRRNRVCDLNLAVPGERARGDERGGERTRNAAGWTVRIQTRSRRTVTRTVTVNPGVRRARGPPVGGRVGEEAVDVEARLRSFASVRRTGGMGHRDVEEVRPVPADDVSPQGGETQLRARVVRPRPRAFVRSVETVTKTVTKRRETRVEGGTRGGGSPEAVIRRPVRGGERGAELALPDVPGVPFAFDIVPGTPDAIMGTPDAVPGTPRVHLAQIRRRQMFQPSRQLVARVPGPRSFVFRTVIRVRSTLAGLAAASGPRRGVPMGLTTPRAASRRFRAGDSFLVASFAATVAPEIRHDVGVQVHHHDALQPLRGERFVQKTVIGTVQTGVRTPVVAVAG